MSREERVLHSADRLQLLTGLDMSREAPVLLAADLLQLLTRLEMSRNAPVLLAADHDMSREGRALLATYRHPSQTCRGHDVTGRVKNAAGPDMSRTCRVMSREEHVLPVTDRVMSATDRPMSATCLPNHADCGDITDTSPVMSTSSGSKAPSEAARGSASRLRARSSSPFSWSAARRGRGRACRHPW